MSFAVVIYRLDALVIEIRQPKLLEPASLVESLDASKQLRQRGQWIRSMDVEDVDLVNVSWAQGA